MIAPARSRVRASCWYWRQVIWSVPALVRLRRRTQSLGAEPPRSRRLFAQLAADLHYGARRARRQPSLLATVTLTFAVGIAAATSVFALTRVVLLQSLPYADAERLVHIAEIDTRRPSSSGNASYLDFLDYRAQNSTLVDVGGYSGGSRTVTGIGSEP